MNKIACLTGFALVVLVLAGCAGRGGGSASAASRPEALKQVNDFPTQARVEYVFQCMRDHGGQNYDNLYHCSCMVDELAKKMSYQTYSEAVVFKNLRSMPGEQGGLFRDPPQAKRLRNELRQAEREAEEVCFVK